MELLNDFDLEGNLISSDNDEQTIDPTALTQTIIDFISTPFSNSNGYKEVSKNTVPDDGVMYEVRPNDNTQLEFDTDGIWLEVKAKKDLNLKPS